MCAWWEQVSAAADGELDEPAREAALTHAQRCATCAAIVAVATSPSAPAPAPVSPALDPSQLTNRERRWLGGRSSRWLLMVAAIVIVAGSAPAYIRGDGLTSESHAARHLASWQIGFGVGLFVAAWMSRMSHAMLVFAATFAALTIIAKAIDVIGGHSGPWIDSVHLVELVAVFLLWRLTPAHMLPWSRRRTPRPASNERQAEQPPLRLVRPERGDLDDVDGLR